MLLMQQQELSGQPLPEPNTFIGGVGATSVTSAADFVAKVSGITESNIQNFQIDVSNNVSFYVDTNYSAIDSLFFNNDEAITYFIDIDKHLVSSSIFTFNSCGSLKFIYQGITNFTYSSTSVSHYDNPNLAHVNFAIITNLGLRWFLRSSNSLKKIDFRTCANINWGIVNRPSIYNLPSLDRLYIGALNTFTNSTTCDQWYKGRRITASFSNIKNGCKVYFNSDLGVMDRYAYGTIQFTVVFPDDTFTINGRTYTAIDGTPTTDGEFDANLGLSQSTIFNNLKAAIAADTRSETLGATSVEYETTAIIFTSSILGSGGNATDISVGNAGGGNSYVSVPFQGGYDVHHFIAYLRDVENANVIECDNTISVNAPTSLSASNQTSTSVDLNFTEPSANANGTDAYEVWVDDGTVYRRHFEYAEISASGDTLDLSEVVADVGTITGVKIKIRTIDGQMNFSPFSNEITLP